jgi:phage-related protein
LSSCAQGKSVDHNIVISWSCDNASDNCGFLPGTGRGGAGSGLAHQSGQEERAGICDIVAAIERLAEFGHELRRPMADLLRDDIHELRIRKGRVNYRILYFFHGRGLAILGHAITKEDVVPPAEIQRCIRRKCAFEADPAGHTYLEAEGGLLWHRPKTR